MPKIITISREFGSGGRELGKRMSDVLGYAYYDKEILEEIARRTDTDQWYVEKILKNDVVPHVPLHFGRSFSHYSTITRQMVDLMVAEQKVIQSLAAKGDCIIVGRSAGIILEDWKPFNIFVYADMEFKIDRCRRQQAPGEDLSVKELTKKIRQVDMARSRGQELISRNKWGSREGYHLCVNTSGLPIKDTAPLVAQYAQFWLENNSL